MAAVAVEVVLVLAVAVAVACKQRQSSADTIYKNVNSQFLFVSELITISTIALFFVESTHWKIGWTRDIRRYVGTSSNDFRMKVFGEECGFVSVVVECWCEMLLLR